MINIFYDTWCNLHTCVKPQWLFSWHFSLFTVNFLSRNHAFLFIYVEPLCWRPCYSSVTWFKERGWQGSRWLRNRCPVFVFFPKHTSSNTRYWKTRRESLCSCSGHTNCMLAKKRLLEPMMKAKGSCRIFAKVHTADNVDPREMSEVWRMAVESLIQGRTWSLSVVCLQVCDMPFPTSTWEGK